MKKFEIYLMVIGIIVLFSMTFISAFDWTNGIASYYRFDESVGITSIDFVGNDNTCFLWNGVAWETGKIGYGAHFDGVDDWANFTYTSGGFDWNDNFSMGFWVKAPSQSCGGNCQLFARTPATGYLDLISDDTVSFRFGVYNVSHTGTVVAGNIWNNQWHYIVAVRNTATKNLSLYVDGTLNASTTTTVPLTAFAGTTATGPTIMSAGPGGRLVNGTIDELGIWNRTLNGSEVAELYNGGAGLSSPFSNANLTVSLNSPSNNTIIATASVDFNATLTPGDYNLNNATLNIWYSNGSLFNQTTNIVTGLSSNSTLFTIYNWPIGNVLWNVYGCQNNSYCAFAANNRTLQYDGVVNSVTYNSAVYQTNLETYTLNLTIPAGKTLANPYLIYNGTPYLASISTGNYQIISKGFDIPLIVGNVSFYFNWSLDGIEFESNNYYQNVSVLNFSLCDSSLTTSFLNVSFKDETTGVAINASIDTSTFKYWLGSGSIYNTYTYSNANANYNYTFCATPNTETLHNNISLQYSSTGYPQRRWFSTQDLTNTTYQKPLYLLASGDGIYSIYMVQSMSGTTVSGVNVIVEKQISGTWTTLETGSTDSAGSVTFWLDPDFDHRLTFTRTGYITQQVTVRPSSSTYTVVMSSTSGNATYSFDLEGIKWKFSPSTGQLIKNTDYTFWFNITAANSNIVGCMLEILNENKTAVLGTVTGCDTAGGNISLTLNTGSNNNLFGRYSLNFGSGYFVLDQDAYWTLITSMVQKGRIGSISDFIIYLKAIPDFGAEKQRSEFTRVVLFFLIMFMVWGIISYSTGWDIVSPGAVIWFIFGITLIASISGYLELSNLTPNATLDKYIVFIIVGLITGGYTLNTASRT